MKRAVVGVMVASIILAFFSFLSGCGSGSTSSIPSETDTRLEELQNEYDQTVLELERLKTDYQDAQDEVAKLKNENDSQNDEIATLKAEKALLEEKVSEAEPWFQLSELEQEQERQRLEEEQAAAAEKQRQEEEAAAIAAEEEEKKGYDTGITYDQLSRSPDDYLLKKVKFYGRVLQVIEGDEEINLRIATSGKYDNVILVSYKPDIVDYRVLEDDYITIYGLSMGLYTYKSTGSGNITIPHIAVTKIDQNL